MHNSTSAFIWRQSKDQYQNPGPATLISWSEVQAPLSGHETYAPYIVAIVKLKDGTTRTAQLVDCLESELKPELPLVPVFRRIYETGHTTPIAYGYKFTPKA